MMISILFVSFFILMAVGVPIAFTLAISTWLAVILGSRYPQIVVIKEMFSGVDSFPLLAVPFFILAAELIVVIGGSVLAPEAASSITMPIPNPAVRTNTAALGDVLYTNYVYFFQLAGMVLLVAMIGAIVLTLRHRTNVKRQDISRQVARTPETAVEVVKVKSGQGL